MIEELNKYKNNNNQSIIDELINIIKLYKINNINELYSYENNSLETTNLQEKIEHSILYYSNNIDGLFTLDYEKNLELSKYINNLKEAIDEENKIKNIIHILDILNMRNILPYQTYKLIVNNKL